MRLHILTSAVTAVIFWVVLVLVTGCDRTPKEEVQHAVIAGEIVNPSAKYIVFMTGNNQRDTVLLDAQNRFSYRIDSVRTGLFAFEHRPETQNFYITPGDSLLLRTNTLAFDESLHFSGDGGTANNFIKQMYLSDENSSELLLSYYKMNPAVFVRKTDSILAQRHHSLENLNAKHKFSPDFLNLAEKIMAYQSYDLKERYTYLFLKYRKDFSDELPEDFHDYRKKVRFNERSLQYSPTYRRFISNYLINKSFQWCAQQDFDNNDCFNLSDAENIKSRIRMVDDLIQLPYLRQEFIRKLASLGVVMAKSRQEIQEILKLVAKTGYYEQGLEDLEQLGSIQTAYMPGTRIDNVPLINSKGETVKFKDLTGKPTIVFLWSIYSTRHIKNHELIQELRKKYPEINFVGINLDVGEISPWRIAVGKYGYNKDKEYQLGQTRVDKRFFKYYLNKLLFLDASGKVVAGDVFINSPEFESRILEFLNR